MILCIDIGNTNVGWGVFSGSTLKASWRTATHRDNMGDEWGLQTFGFLDYFGIEKKVISSIGISNVVPPLHSAFAEMGKRYFGAKPAFAGESLKIPMPVLTDHPAEVGSDLLVGAYGAYHRYGGPLIVVDFGTATTFSAVSKKGEFLGTAIAPGISISAEALFAKAAKLPRIQFEKPPKGIGKNTVHSMQSGFLYGFTGQAEKIISMMKTELGGNPRVVATGGLASLVAEETAEISAVDQNIILEGLRLLMSQKKR